MNRWILIIVLVSFGCALACKLDPAKVPPCDPRYPDPIAGCFGESKDAGTDG
jgi:hypothetical protein